MFQAVESNEEMNEMQNDNTEHGERKQLERGRMNRERPSGMFPPRLSMHVLRAVATKF